VARTTRLRVQPTRWPCHLCPATSIVRKGWTRNTLPTIDTALAILFCRVAAATLRANCTTDSGWWGAALSRKVLEPQLPHSKRRDRRSRHDPTSGPAARRPTCLAEHRRHPHPARPLSYRGSASTRPGDQVRMPRAYGTRGRLRSSNNARPAVTRHAAGDDHVCSLKRPAARHDREPIIQLPTMPASALRKKPECTALPSTNQDFSVSGACA